MEKPIRVDGAYAAPQLASFGADFKALIFGATGALGGAFADALLQQAHTLVTASRGDKADFPGILQNANFNPFPSPSYQPLRWLGVTAVGHATSILSS